MAFITSSCSVDGGSDKISVDVDKYRSLSDTAVLQQVNTEKKTTTTKLEFTVYPEIGKGSTNGYCLPGRISINEQ